jgi:hypothetical protein
VAGLIEYWILDQNHELVPADLLVWGRWFEKPENRFVRSEEIGPFQVSTIFLGFDHRIRVLSGQEEGPPLLFETMAFRPSTAKERRESLDAQQRLGVSGMPHLREGIAQERCSTWDEALEQHQRIADQVRRLAAS